MPFTLEFLSTEMQKGLSTTDAALTTAISGVGNGDTISIPQMVDLQTKMSRYTVTASLCSACVKEMSDTMKGVVQKIS